jgi:hypothetical protein
MKALAADIESAGDTGGWKRRELQRLELYTSVVKRLHRSDALMPEIVGVHKRGHFCLLRG